MMTTLEICASAKASALSVASCSEETRNRALELMADSLETFSEEILCANLLDVNAAKEKLGDVMTDRLLLNNGRIKSMADGIRALISLPCPVGRVISTYTAPNGIKIEKVSAPFGVVAIIYESRPNVTSDAAALCVKSGNACVLRSGKEAHNTSAVIVKALRTGLKKAGLNEDCVCLIEDTTRASATELMTANGLIDLLIPRGGRGLIDSCVNNATVPVIATGTGICHVYVDEYANLDKALSIIENAKTSRPSVCNAAEVMLVHQSVAKEFLPKVAERLQKQRSEKGLTPVKFLGDSSVSQIIDCESIGENGFDTEFLDYTLAIGIVDSVNSAIAHVNAHSTGHSEAIITENTESSKLFSTLIDSAAVYINASTRFTDGGEFGMGCEMGISTQKLHARGPMGLNELNTYKYVITGDGQIR